jgi:hypothetical protein
MLSQDSFDLHRPRQAVAQRGEFVGVTGDLAKSGFRDGVLAVWQGVDSLIDCRGVIAA